jgi:hypothetical protein
MFAESVPDIDSDAAQLGSGERLAKTAQLVL